MERVDITDLEIILPEHRGYNIKYWVFADKEKLVKYNSRVSPDADVMEMLAAEILKLLGIETVNVTLGQNTNQKLIKVLKLDNGNCAVIDSFLTDKADVTINLLYNEWVQVKTSDVQINISSCFYKMFSIFSSLNSITSEDLEGMKRDYIRMVFGDCLIGNEDRRLKNIEAIFNERTFSYRLAPSFDNALAFNAYDVSAKKGIDNKEENHEINFNEVYCYIGNQAFAVSEIITYIINHYYNEVTDIIDSLNNTQDIDIVFLLKDYLEELPSDKVEYIFEYLRQVRDYTNTKVRENFVK